MKTLFLLIFATFATPLAFAGTYSKTLWDKNELVTCFAPAEEKIRKSFTNKLNVRDWSEEDKTKVQTWVNSEYTLEHTGIHFSGWLDCAEAPLADVILFYNKTPVKRSPLDGVAGGYGPIDKIEGYPDARSYVAISTSGMIKNTVIHEFGHVAGLAHEHNHPDVKRSSKKQCLNNKPENYPSYFFYTVYDDESIMSYCNRNRSTLSEKEANLLKTLYPEN